MEMRIKVKMELNKVKEIIKELNKVKEVVMEVRVKTNKDEDELNKVKEVVSEDKQR